MWMYLSYYDAPVICDKTMSGVLPQAFYMSRMSTNSFESWPHFDVIVSQAAINRGCTFTCHLTNACIQHNSPEPSAVSFKGPDPRYIKKVPIQHIPHILV